VAFLLVFAGRSGRAGAPMDGLVVATEVPRWPGTTPGNGPATGKGAPPWLLVGS